MVTCPEGHPSAASDYCDICGAAIAAAAPVPPAAECPACGAPIAGRFCEACGRDSALPAPARVAETVTLPEVPEQAAAQQVWVATVVADREFYQRVLDRKGPDADRVEFPAYYPPRRIPLHGTDFLIGKHSVSQGVHPEIDLGIPPVDIGVSRAHARLHVSPDGITVTDLGSTNGTSLNGADELIAPNTPVPLAAGARIHVGGWTTITVSYETP
ncbi:FHA domain-containing protein [Nocardia sp. CDC159]|uniref:FHA domain-containing protein n=1 Tax=Nocardia pulmonis TaxID=2951408 RepID=A0A9X2E2T8_9NOCA|nr:MULTISPECIES: FHA domain-containing protein [Nocardia]MCM6773102.1 FHA domain-containing protein [Nocardia pulmonis]MCM6785595.1 FHA domain-containing protein [Nocardia sp. CDC159]